MKKYIYILMLPALLILGGCEKVLDIAERDALAGETALRTVQNVEQAVIGAYGALSWDMHINLNMTFSDEVRVGEFYNATTTHEWQYGSEDVGIRDNFTAINPNYQIIDRANRVLAVVNTADSTRPGDEALRRRLRGEALFLRSWGHFVLFQYYSGNYTPDGLGMPYMEIPGLLSQARINLGEYFQKLNRDISEAKTLLPASVADINRANGISAAALHARIALYQRDWATAEANATIAINALPLASAAAFPGLWMDANTQETSFRLVRTPQVGARTGGLFRGISTAPGGNIQIGTVTWFPTDKILGVYDQTNDVRYNAYFINEPLLQAAGRRSTIVKKYSRGAYTTPDENFGNAKIFRTGEMYLIRAEARAEQAKFTGANSAESDLNTLRTARIAGYTPITIASAAQAITLIIEERFKELAFEGHRFWDLKRRNLPVQRIGDDAPNANAATLPARDFRFTMPIPQREMEANKLMVQNEGY